MQKPNEYFYALLQARQAAGANAAREIDARIVAHLDALAAEVDYTHEDPDNDVKGEDIENTPEVAS